MQSCLICLILTGDSSTYGNKRTIKDKILDRRKKILNHKVQNCCETLRKK